MEGQAGTGGGPRSGGCARAAGYGCLGLVGLVAVLAIAVWASWGMLRESRLVRGVRDSVATAKAEVVKMTELRSSLQEAYPAERIDVNAHVVSNQGTTTKTLLVTLANPRFAFPESGSDERTTARRIAAAVAARYPGLERYDRLELALESGDAAAGGRSVTRFDFPTRELVPAAPASAP